MAKLVTIQELAPTLTIYPTPPQVRAMLPVRLDEAVFPRLAGIMAMPPANAVERIRRVLDNESRSLTENA